MLEVFGTEEQIDDNEGLVSQLYEKIGWLEFQFDWLKKNLNNPVNEMRAMVKKHNYLSIEKQCKLLELSCRSYYKPKMESVENLEIMILVICWPFSEEKDL